MIRRAAFGDDGAVRLARIAADAERPRAQRIEVLLLLGTRAPRRNRPLIEPLAQAGAPLEPEALAALGAIGGGLPAARVEPLLDRPQSAVRAVAARYASGPLAERRLPALVRSDPDASVRAAAAITLADTHTVWGLDGALPALGDPDPAVRAAAAEALGRLGAPAVSRLEAVARTHPRSARRHRRPHLRRPERRRGAAPPGRRPARRAPARPRPPGPRPRAARALAARAMAPAVLLVPMASVAGRISSVARARAPACASPTAACGS